MAEVNTRAKWEVRWMTVKEAAEYTRTDEEWILAHIKSGAMKFAPTARRKSTGPKGPQRRIVDRFKLDALMEALEILEPQKPEMVDAESGLMPPTVTKPRSTRGMSAREKFDRGL